MKKEDLGALFKEKILAIRNYPSTKREFTTLHFLSPVELIEIMEEVKTGESDITPAGKKFLEVYYSQEELNGLLKSVDHNPSKWLTDLVPMEISAFILQANGELSEREHSPTLDHRLLPPTIPEK